VNVYVLFIVQLVALSCVFNGQKLILHKLRALILYRRRRFINHLLTYLVLVICGIMPTSRRYRITATSSIRHLTAPSRTAPPAQLLWPTGFLCGWSISLEFPAGQLAESGYWLEQFQTISEDVSVRNVLMHSVH